MSSLNPDSWSDPVTSFSAAQLPLEKGILVPGLGRLRPFDFYPGAGSYPRLAVVTEEGITSDIGFDQVPYMANFHDPYSVNYQWSYMALLHHRAADQAQREPTLRILEIAEGIGYYKADIRYGENPEFPGQERFLMGVRTIGFMALTGPRIPTYLEIDDVTFKYLPLPALETPTAEA